MARTKVNDEQLRFTSSRTGEHALGTYLENAEYGDRTVADLLGDLFVADGTLLSSGLAALQEIILPPAASNPSTRLNGDPLESGDLYFNTSSNTLFVYHSSTWNSLPNTAHVAALAAIAANITTVAGIASDVTAVATNASNVTAVADNATNINAVSGIESDVTAVATNIADVTNFADVYLGAATSNPATRLSGDSLEAGDLYFNTVAGLMRVYNGATWDDVAVTPGSFLQVSNDLSDVNSAATARTNLGAAALGANTFTGTQDFNGQSVTGGAGTWDGEATTAYGFLARENNIGSTASNVTLDMDAYSVWYFEPTGNIDVDVTNVPTIGSGSVLGYAVITGGGDHTLTLKCEGAAGGALTPGAAGLALSTTTGRDVVAIIKTNTDQVMFKVAGLAIA